MWQQHGDCGGSFMVCPDSCSIPFCSPANKTAWAGIAQSVQRFAMGWTVRESNPGAGEIFSTRPDRPWGPPSHLHNGYRVSFLGVQRSGWDVGYPPPSNAEVKERVELHVCSPSEPSWLFLRWILVKTNVWSKQSVCRRFFLNVVNRNSEPKILPDRLTARTGISTTEATGT